MLGTFERARPQHRYSYEVVSVYLFFSARKKRSEFAQSVLQYSDGLYRYALKLSKNEDEAEDLVQETLLKAYKAYSRTRRDSNHRAWAYTILRNEFISRKRRPRREIPLEPGIQAEHQEKNSDTVIPFKGEWQQHVSDEILVALDQLGEVHRSVVVLCDIEGLTYDEIAQVMGCPVGTVRSRVFHARKQLRQHLKQYARDVGLEKIDEAM